MRLFPQASFPNCHTCFWLLWAKEMLQFNNTSQHCSLKCSENRSLYRTNMLRTERKLATIAHRGGMCWHCIKCNAEVFEAQRVQVFCLCFLCSPAQITKAPLRQAPLFFPLSEQAHKASCARLQLSKTKGTTCGRALMHLFEAQVARLCRYDYFLWQCTFQREIHYNV